MFCPKRIDQIQGAIEEVERIVAQIRPELDQDRAEMAKTGVPARVFTDFTWSTLKSRSAKRRTVGKAEILPPVNETQHDPEKPNPGNANPRFVVTSQGAEEHDAKTLYERAYCARGDMENRIKNKQLDLFGFRASPLP